MDTTTASSAKISPSDDPLRLMRPTLHAAGIATADLSDEEVREQFHRF